PVVRIDRGEHLQVARPSIERDQPEPELLLRAVLEEVAPSRVVILTESGVPDREPRGLPSLAEGPSRRGRRESERHADDQHDQRSHPHTFTLPTVPPAAPPCVVDGTLATRRPRC